MSIYALLDENDNEIISVTNETFTLLDDEFGISADIIPRSFSPGSDFPGIQRDESKSLNFSYDVNSNSDEIFRTTVNTLMKAFRKTRTIKDKTLKIQTEAIMVNHSIKYDSGSFLRGARLTVEFEQLTPYWEDLTYLSEDLATGTDGQASLTINNTGFIETPPLITIITSNPCDQIYIENIGNNEGIEIQDEQFGINGLNIYIIDNKNGESELGPGGGITPLDRKNKIIDGTGFFNLQPGLNNLLFEMNCAVTVQIQWKRRYYL
jgi:hypothetical protein